MLPTIEASFLLKESHLDLVKLLTVILYVYALLKTLERATQSV